MKCELLVNGHASLTEMKPSGRTLVSKMDLLACLPQALVFYLWLYRAICSPGRERSVGGWPRGSSKSLDPGQRVPVGIEGVKQLRQPLFSGRDSLTREVRKRTCEPTSRNSAHFADSQRVFHYRQAEGWRKPGGESQVSEVDPGDPMVLG